MRHTLDVAELGHRDDAILLRDEILNINLAGYSADLGASGIGVFVAYLKSLGLDYLESFGLAAEYLVIFLYLFTEGGYLVLDLCAFHVGELSEPHGDYRLSLSVVQTESLAQSSLGRRLILRLPYDSYDLVDEVDGYLQTLEDVHPLLGLFEVKDSSALDDALLMLYVALEHFFEREYLRLAADYRQHDSAEGRLQLGHHEQMVEHHLRRSLALYIYLDMHTVAVGVILDVRDALQPLVLDEGRDVFYQSRLVHAVRQLRNDYLESAVLCLDYLGLCAYHDLAAAGSVGGAYARATHDETAGREIRTRHTFHDLAELRVGIVDKQAHRVDGLAEVMGRYVGRHTDGDTVRAVDQEVREPRGQHRRLGEDVVEGRHEVDRVLIYIREHFRGDLAHPAFGIPVSRGWVAVDRAEVAVTVDEHIAHRKILSESYHSVIDRSVAVGMIFTQNFADGVGALAVRLRGGYAVLIHTVQYAPVDGLESVPYVRQSARHDDAHRIIEERLSHLAVDIHVYYLTGAVLGLVHHL